MCMVGWMIEEGKGLVEMVVGWEGGRDERRI